MVSSVARGQDFQPAPPHPSSGPETFSRAGAASPYPSSRRHRAGFSAEQTDAGTARKAHGTPRDGDAFGEAGRRRWTRFERSGSAASSPSVPPTKQRIALVLLPDGTDPLHRLLDGGHGGTVPGRLIATFRGGRSGSHQKALREARETCLEELAEEASGLGADAVVGVDLDYSEISGGGKGMVLLVASGTAVRLR